jgi:hypothetical protein
MDVPNTASMRRLTDASDDKWDEEKSPEAHKLVNMA